MRKFKAQYIWEKIAKAAKIPYLDDLSNVRALVYIELIISEGPNSKSYLI